MENSMGIEDIGINITTKILSEIFRRRPIVVVNVLDERAQPVENAIVILGCREAKTAKSGKVIFEDMDVGTHAVAVKYMGKEESNLDVIHLRRGEEASLTITLPDSLFAGNHLELQNKPDGKYENILSDIMPREKIAKPTGLTGEQKPPASSTLNPIDVISPKPAINDGLIAHWSFDGHANDAINNNNGTLHGGVTLTTDRNGRPNSAYLFNGIDGYISVPDSPSLNPTNQLTITFWVFVDGFTGRYKWSSIIYKGDDRRCCYQREYTIWANKSSFFHLSCAGDGGDARSLDTDGITIEGRWIFLAIMIDRQVKHKNTWFVDGVFNTEIDDDYSSFFQSSQDLIFGASSDKTYYLKGALSDIRFYNRVLSNAEIQQLYKEKSSSQDSSQDDIASKEVINNVTEASLTYSIEKLREEGCTAVKKSFANTETLVKITSGLQNWGEHGTAIRLRCNKWENSDIVFLVKNNGMFGTQFYVWNVPENNVPELINKMASKKYSRPHWTEGRKYITHCFGSFQSSDRNIVLSEIEEIAKKLNEYYS